MQKRTIRLKVGAKRYDHTDPIFDALKILRLQQIYIYTVQSFIFKFYHKILPNFYDNFFQFNNENHNHDTRHQKLFRTPLLKHFPSTRSVRSAGVPIFNYFTKVISFDCSFITYKIHLKKHILSNGDIFELIMRWIELFCHSRYEYIYLYMTNHRVYSWTFISWYRDPVFVKKTHLSDECCVLFNRNIWYH